MYGSLSTAALHNLLFGTYKQKDGTARQVLMKGFFLVQVTH